MTFPPDIGRCGARLEEPARSAVIADNRRIAIVGARGWIGRATLALLREALEDEVFARRVVCFGSADGTVVLDGGVELKQRALSALPELDRCPTILFHLAFLTKDKVGGMDAGAYEAANRRISHLVRDSLDVIGVDRLFIASSGAAAFADETTAASDLRLYGRLKREDEELFAAWAESAAQRGRAAIGRIFSITGPWMNKHGTYAMASFIIDALAGRSIEVRAPMPVLRSYVAVRELVSLVFAALLTGDDEPILRFETGGTALELGEVARCVAQTLGGEVLRRPITQSNEDRYVGDDDAWRALLARYGIEHVPLSTQIAETAAWLAREATGFAV